MSINNYKNGSYVWQSLPYNRRVEFEVNNDSKEKLKIVPVRIPLLYDLNPNPDDVKKEVKRLDLTYTVQVGAYSKPVQRNIFDKIKDVQMFYTNKLYKYTTGEFKLAENAKKELIRIKKLGFNDAYVQKLSEYYPQLIKNIPLN